MPTKTSHLTNDSGFITSYTDEKLKWTASTSTNTYYPLVSTSTATTSTANTLNGINFYQYYNTAGGYRRLELGNTTANQSTGGAYGAIRLFGANATYYGDLVPGNPELGSSISGAGLSANRTWKLPDKSGTIALTSDLSSYIPKPTDTGSFGFVLKYITANSFIWDAPDLYEVGIVEDLDNPGTYILTNIPSDVRDAAMGGQKLVLRLGLSDTIGTDAIVDDYIFTNCEVEQHYDDSTGISYMAVRFQGRMNLEEATVTIYLDETEALYTDGEVHVERKNAVNAGSSGSDGIIVGDWKICWGSVTLATTSASGSGTFTAPYYISSSKISLDYSGVPYVWCQVMGQWNGIRYATPHDISETGFYIRLYASSKNSTNTQIRWLTIGKA